MKGNGTMVVNERMVIREFNKPVNISELLLGFDFAADLRKCLNDKSVFGLRSGTEFDSILVFNCRDFHLYDYSRGRFNHIDCGSYHRMLNFIRFSLQSHRIYVDAEESIRFLREKKIIP